jgi:hypothetical protein
MPARMTCQLWAASPTACRRKSWGPNAPSLRITYSRYQRAGGDRSDAWHRLDLATELALLVPDLDSRFEFADLTVQLLEMRLDLPRFHGQVSA